MVVVTTVQSCVSACNEQGNSQGESYRLVEAGCVCHMFGNPASFKGSGVVQPVVWPMMKGNKVYVGRGMVCQEVLPFIEGPTVHTQGNSARERMWKKGERGARGRGPGRLQEIDENP